MNMFKKDSQERMIAYYEDDQRHLLASWMGFGHHGELPGAGGSSIAPYMNPAWHEEYIRQKMHLVMDRMISPMAFDWITEDILEYSDIFGDQMRSLTTDATDS